MSLFFFFFLDPLGVSSQSAPTFVTAALTLKLTLKLTLGAQGTHSCTARAIESAVEPVSLTLSKVTFGRSSSSLSLLMCRGDRPLWSACAAEGRGHTAERGEPRRKERERETKREHGPLLSWIKLKSFIAGRGKLRLGHHMRPLSCSISSNKLLFITNSI